MAGAICYYQAMPPFYVQLALLLLAGSLLFCFGCYAFGRRGLPPVPSARGSIFPNHWDTLYTAVFITVFCLSVATTLPFTKDEESALLSISVSGLIVSMILQCLLYMPMLVRFAILPRANRPQQDAGETLGIILSALAAILLFSTVLTILRADTLLTELTGCPEQQDIVQVMMSGSVGQKIVLALAAVIMAPIGEEVCFRGFVYPILRQRAGLVWATIATGLLFGASHTSLVQFLPLAFFGMVQCIVYEKTKTILVPIAVHAIFNSLSVLYILCSPLLPSLPV